MGKIGGDQGGSTEEVDHVGCEGRPPWVEQYEAWPLTPLRWRWGWWGWPVNRDRIRGESILARYCAYNETGSHDALVEHGEISLTLDLASADMRGLVDATHVVW